MSIFRLLLRTSPWPAVIAVVMGLVSGASSVGLIILINAALNRERHFFAAHLWSFLGVGSVMLLSKVTAQILLAYLSQQAIFEQRLRLSRRILEAPLRHLEEIGAPRLLSTLTSDVLVITNGLLVIPEFCISLAIVLGCLVYLGCLSWVALFPLLGIAALGTLSYQMPLAKALSLLKLAREEQDVLFGHFRALTDGTKELKLHRPRREAFLRETFQPAAARFRRYNFLGSIVYTAAASWGQLLFFIIIGIFFLAAARIDGIDPEALTGYVLTVVFLRSPMESITTVLPILGQAKVAFRKVEDLGLSLGHVNPQELLKEVRSRPSYDHLELCGVTHAYSRETEETDFILGPIDLALRSGEIVFLVGGNGSGKTTLAKLITGLYTPEAGWVRLNGQLVTDENREWYRQHFSAIFSDYYLFESIQGLGDSDLDKRARSYLNQLRLDHKVRVENGRFSTTALSNGQRKRLALLSAYLEDRPIYLFDEWASDQDPLFKEIFYRELLSELKAKGKTVVVISHDEKYFHVADRIIKLDYGKIECDEPPRLEVLSVSVGAQDPPLEWTRAGGAAE